LEAEVLASVPVRRLVCFIWFVWFVPLAAVSIARAEGASPSEPLSTTTTKSDLSSPALFPATAVTVPPSNIEAPPFIAALMREMWTASPTFRRQCARIAQAVNGRIQISIGKPRSVDVRAASVIERQKTGQWVAIVEVSIEHDLVELIGHELEHVIEQIDGIDLRRLAKQGLAGVSPLSGERYETARAVATGKRVAQEYASRRRVAS
jgi:hypothetical protein